jgi:hypothetical protein
MSAIRSRVGPISTLRKYHRSCGWTTPLVLLSSTDESVDSVESVDPTGPLVS